MTTMSDAELKFTVHYGRCEVRSWLEAEMLPDGNLKLIGMGSRTDYDLDGKITAHKVEPTCAVMIVPVQPPRQTFLQWLFS